MDQRKIRGLVHKRGDEGQPGCWTWGGAEPSGTAGSSGGGAGNRGDQGDAGEKGEGLKGPG